MWSCEFIPLETKCEGQYECIHCGLRTIKPRNRRCLNQLDETNRIALVTSVTSIVRNSGGGQATDKRPREIRDHLQCTHIGEQFDEDVPAKPGCGCKSENPMTALFECRLVPNEDRECTPLGIAVDESIYACRNCNHYQMKEDNDG